MDIQAIIAASIPREVGNDQEVDGGINRICSYLFSICRGQ